MSINIPNKDQWQKMNEHLSNIAGALGTQIDISTWEGVQKAVRAGVAPELFPIGTQLSVNHSVYGTHLYDVVAHDYFKSAHNPDAHTMTLLCHDVCIKGAFDTSEAFYYADTELPMGTYNFTLVSNSMKWAAGTYQFTLGFALPKGGQLCISSDNSKPLTTLKVQAFASQTTTVATGEYEITLGEGGTSLGTFGVELNNANRVSVGSSNYKESAIRQLLNSSADVGKVWTPQTKFDRPPAWVDSTSGFMKGLDEGLVNVVGEVIVPCVANDTYESPDSTTVKGEKYTVRDKFYLPSETEIFGTNHNATADGSVLFPYYEGATNTDRIKYHDGTTWHCYLRSAYPLNSQIIAIGRDGSFTWYITAVAGYFAPACTIV